MLNRFPVTIKSILEVHCKECVEMHVDDRNLVVSGMNAINNWRGYHKLARLLLYACIIRASLS